MRRMQKAYEGARKLPEAAWSVLRANECALKHSCED